MKILFTGDVTFQEASFVTDTDKTNEIIAEVKPVFDSVDVRSVNLETPFANKEDCKPIQKSGPNITSNPETVSFLKTLNVDFTTIANNHIGDYGDSALFNTLKVLEENGIAHCGAGKDIFDAYKAHRFEKSGIKVSILSVCENEFGVATKNSAGSAGFKIGMLHNRIKEEKAVSDFVVVVFHGGNEYNPIPSPTTMERYRLLIDIGADAVIGGHTHCPQGHETYNGKPIIYSMGNFYFPYGVFGKRPADHPWYYGYMTILELEPGKAPTYEIVPYKMDNETTVINVYKGENKKIMLDYINKLSEIIKDEDLVQNYYDGWCYFNNWNHPNTPEWAEEQDDVLTARSRNANHLHCESHCELAKRIYTLIDLDEFKDKAVWAEKIQELGKMPL